MNWSFGNVLLNFADTSLAVYFFARDLNSGYFFLKLAKYATTPQEIFIIFCFLAGAKKIVGVFFRS